MPGAGAGGKQKSPGALITVEDIVRSHWSEFGRNYYTRYDYEGVDSLKADKVMELLKSKMVSPCNLIMVCATLL